MSYRFAAVVTFLLAAAALAPAQPGGTYSKAVPPDKAALDRLNLKTEWVQFLPVEGTRDALTQIQTAPGIKDKLPDQVFVQTRAGLLVTINANTGEIMWAARLGNGSAANTYPVAFNSRFVFVASVTRLYAFYRDSGVTEFVADLGSPPTVGLAADELAVYCVLGVRPGSAGAHRIAVYELTPPAVVESGKDAGNLVDALSKRYTPSTASTADGVTYKVPTAPRPPEAPTGGISGTRSPSLAAVPRVNPPYGLDTRAPAPSLATLPSVQPPYHLRTESSKYIQQTPSLSTIPPSVAAALALTDLRPKAYEPAQRWEKGLTARISYPLHITPGGVWAVLDGDTLILMGKYKEPRTNTIPSGAERMTTIISAAPAAAEEFHYVPLDNGTLLAIDAVNSQLVEEYGGKLSLSSRVKWRGVPGGINNHTPFITKNYLYASGDDTGVVCLHRLDGPFKDKGDAKEEMKADPANPLEAIRAEGRPREYYAGDVVWRSDDSADRIVGANEEFVYIRDRQGRLLVYDAKRPTDPARKRSAPLGTANLGEFNVHVVNTASDRVFLAANNGLIVCVRDANPKYTRPVSVWPAAKVNPAPRAGVDTGTVSDPKKDGEPKKDP